MMYYIVDAIQSYIKIKMRNYSDIPYTSNIYEIH